jgi:hypothetical protein
MSFVPAKLKPLPVLRAAMLFPVIANSGCHQKSSYNEECRAYEETRANYHIILFSSGTESVKGILQKLPLLVSAAMFRGSKSNN